MSQSSDYQIVARAIRCLEEDFLSQPSLDQLATRLGMSKFHLQRLFTRWAGVSPKRFLQFLTVEHAKGLLQQSAPVLKTAFESGLSGSARLHDLFISTEGVTPGEYKAGGLALDIRYGFHPTPFGTGFFAHTDRGLCHLSFLSEEASWGEHSAGGDSGERDASVAGLQEEWPGARFREDSEMAASMAETIFPGPDGDSAQTPLSLFLKGTNYQIKVWNALLRIPRGAVTTYGGLATEMGAPKAARAVGTAVANNPIAYLIPCHRVIRTLGVFGEYRWGSVRKKAILGWEAARKAS